MVFVAHENTEVHRKSGPGSAAAAKVKWWPLLEHTTPKALLELFLDIQSTYLCLKTKQICTHFRLKEEAQGA